VITALAAIAIAGVILALGYRDVTRPTVAFGVPWFAFVGLAQLRLTNVEQPWGIGFTLVAFGGGLAFVVAAFLAGGSEPARGSIRLNREMAAGGRLVIVALVLMAGGVVAVLYRAHLTHGVPLFADNPDLVRGRGLVGGGMPAWSSALLGGFYIAFWATLAAIWVFAARVSRLRLVPLWLLAAAALVGIATDASRNLVLFTLVVPALGAYLLSSPERRRGNVAWLGGAVCVLIVGVGGLYAARLERGGGGAHTYIRDEIDKQPTLVRPLVPLYVNAAFPLEAARRIYKATPHRYPYELGAASLTSLPDKAFPEGKSRYPRHVSVLMSLGGAGLSWTVGSYQGRLIADLGWEGVLFGSILLGFAMGGLYRWARGRAGFLPVAVIAYLAYYSAFMVYDNPLSFSVIAVYDLAVMSLASAYVFRWTDKPLAALRQLGRGLAADGRAS
jgi:hypothetical protein